MPEKKIVFKLYTYVNGLGETVFEAARWHGWIPATFFGPIFWARLNSGNPNDWFSPRQWDSRDAALRSLHSIVEREREALVARGRAKLAASLRLVVVEKVEL